MKKKILVGASITCGVIAIMVAIALAEATRIVYAE